MKNILLAMLCVAFCTPFCVAQNQSCPVGTEDMMNYFTMGYPNRLTNNMGPGTANPIFTNVVPDLGENFATSGYFLWTKSPAGYPWDVKTFDQQFIYDRTTELSWTDPTTFKGFDIDLPMSTRCVPLQSAVVIKIPSANTNYTSYANCLPTLTQNLGYVLNRISVPNLVNTGGNLGTIQTRFFTYRYSCDLKYQNCLYQEVFSLGYQMGLYDWRYYQNKSGIFKMVARSKINQFSSGSATPYLPCVSSYQ